MFTGCAVQILAAFAVFRTVAIGQKTCATFLSGYDLPLSSASVEVQTIAGGSAPE